MDPDKVGSDQALWPRKINGDGEAFGLLIAKHRHRVRGQCAVKSESLGAAYRFGKLASGFKKLAIPLPFRAKGMRDDC